ncbi:MAG: hypothetical protein ABIQ32_06370 [Sphingomicrobium sp.]
MAHLVAPNKYHHVYLNPWITQYPDAKLYGTRQLIRKRSDLTFDESLEEAAPEAWATCISQTVFSGSRAYDEAIFFHLPSHTAVLTDLIVNADLQEQTLLGGLLARFDGIVAPKGSTPRLYRWSIKDRVKARHGVETLLSWAPEKCVISHGAWFKTDAATELRMRFAWILQ